MVIFKIIIKRHQCRLITPPNRFSYCILGIQSHASIENEWKLLKIGFENAWNPTLKLIKYGIKWWFSTGSRVHKLHTHIHIRNQSWILKYFNIVSIWLLNHRWITSYLLSAILKSTLSVLLSLISSAEQQAHSVSTTISAYRQFVTSESIKCEVKSSFPHYDVYVWAHYERSKFDWFTCRHALALSLHHHQHHTICATFHTWCTCVYCAMLFVTASVYVTVPKSIQNFVWTW